MNTHEINGDRRYEFPSVEWIHFVAPLGQFDQENCLWTINYVSYRRFVQEKLDCYRNIVEPFVLPYFRPCHTKRYINKEIWEYKEFLGLIKVLLLCAIPSRLHQCIKLNRENFAQEKLTTLVIEIPKSCCLDNNGAQSALCQLIIDRDIDSIH